VTPLPGLVVLVRRRVQGRALPVGGLQRRRRADPSRRQGRVVQVEPMKLMLRAPAIKRLKLKCVKLLSSLACIFNMRHYSKGNGVLEDGDKRLAVIIAVPLAGGYARPVLNLI
jgi:hypothetical protein